MRSLIRCRLALKESEKRVKLQINSFLLSQGLHWDGNKWTHRHRMWLHKLEFKNNFLQQALNEYLGHMEYLQIRIRNLDDQIEKIAQSDIYAPSVKKLRAFKGIGTLAAMLLIAEITGFRFQLPRWVIFGLPFICHRRSSPTVQKSFSKAPPVKGLCPLVIFYLTNEFKL